MRFQPNRRCHDIQRLDVRAGAREISKPTTG
jgi:hypothetical protein